MFKKSYNRAVLRIRIDTVTPLLIRAGDSGLDPTAADLTCVRTRHARYGSTVYIPGSSLKGVLRSAAEATVRGRTFRDGIQGACDPLNHDTSCGRKMSGGRENGKNEMPAETHRRHCLACRVFGSLAMKGRASPRDLFPWDETASVRSSPQGDNQRSANRLEMRHGVSIDRISGSVRHGPFEQELVPAGISFWGEIALENYQSWQLGLLAQAFGEINDGFAQLGSTKSRGLGVAKLEVESILHEQTTGHGDRPAGAGALVADDQEHRDYGLFPDEAFPIATREPRGLADRFTVQGAEATRAWLDIGLAALGRVP
jgi:CRISPR-associated protein Csm3